MKTENTTENTEAAKDVKTVVDRATFASAGDWINRIFAEFATDTSDAVEAVAAVAEVKNEAGDVTQEAVPAIRGKAGTTKINADAVEALAVANAVTIKEGGYPNDGMLRMNVGNMLRAAARKRHGLNLPTEDGLATSKSDYVFVEAPDDFTVNDEKTHNADGSKIAKAKPAEAPTADETAPAE
jgi:hypothetical protein